LNPIRQWLPEGVLQIAVPGENLDMRPRFFAKNDGSSQCQHIKSNVGCVAIRTAEHTFEIPLKRLDVINCNWHMPPFQRLAFSRLRFPSDRPYAPPPAAELPAAPSVRNAAAPRKTRSPRGRAHRPGAWSFARPNF